MGLLQKYSPGGDIISAPSAEHSELRELPGLGVEHCCNLGDWLPQEDCSEPGLSPGLGVGDCSDVGDSPGLWVGGCSVLGDSRR